MRSLMKGSPTRTQQPVYSAANYSSSTTLEALFAQAMAGELSHTLGTSYIDCTGSIFRLTPPTYQEPHLLMAYWVELLPELYHTSEVSVLLPTVPFFGLSFSVFSDFVSPFLLPCSLVTILFAGGRGLKTVDLFSCTHNGQHGKLRGSHIPCLDAGDNRLERMAQTSRCSFD
jgi:hypothetical protein